MTFPQRFNIDVPIEEARRRFTNRVLNLLFSQFPSVTRDERTLANRVLGETGLDPTGVRDLVQGDFNRLLDMIERWIAAVPSIESAIQRELEQLDVDLEIELRDGKFFPTGAALLDDRLVNDPLAWLTSRGLDTVHEPLTKALEHLLRGRQDPRYLRDAITDAYEALEAMARITCQSNQTFGRIEREFIRTIGLSADFRPIVQAFPSYIHPYRHGQPQSRPVPSLIEVEALIYLVGIMIRLAVQQLP